MNKSIIPILGIVAVLVISGCASTDTAPTGSGDGDGAASAAGTAQTPRHVFEAYRRAIDEGDLEAFKNAIPAEMIETMEAEMPGGMSEETFRQVFGMMKPFMVPVSDVLVEEEKIEGNTANWTVSDKNDPNNRGTISFVKEGGYWKMLKEEWESVL
jgi:hypothetical protein